MSDKPKASERVRRPPAPDPLDAALQALIYLAALNDEQREYIGELLVEQGPFWTRVIADARRSLDRAQTVIDLDRIAMRRVLASGIMDEIGRGPNGKPLPAAPLDPMAYARKLAALPSFDRMLLGPFVAKRGRPGGKGIIRPIRPAPDDEEY